MHFRLTHDVRRTARRARVERRRNKMCSRSLALESTSFVGASVSRRARSGHSFTLDARVGVGAAMLLTVAPRARVLHTVQVLQVGSRSAPVSLARSWRILSSSSFWLGNVAIVKSPPASAKTTPTPSLASITPLTNTTSRAATRTLRVMSPPNNISTGCFLGSARMAQFGSAWATVSGAARIVRKRNVCRAPREVS